MESREYTTINGEITINNNLIKKENNEKEVKGSTISPLATCRNGIDNDLNEKIEKNITSIAEDIAIIIAQKNCNETTSSLLHLLDVSDFSLPALSKYSEQSLIHTFNFSPPTAKRLSNLLNFYFTLTKNSGKPPLRIKTSADIYSYMHSRLYGSSVERVYALYLNQANSVVGCQLICVGGINQSLIDLRIIMRGVLDCLGVSVILVHNHPSGTLGVSNADDTITRKVKNACKMLDVRFLDHLIYTDNGYYSYKDEHRIYTL